jgi:hypothetical protein
MNSVPLKYDWVAGGHTVIPLAMAASQYFKDRGGKFVDINGSGYGETLDASSTMIFGWAETPGHGDATYPTYYLTNSSAGVTKLPVIIPGSDSIFRMPIAYYSATYTVNFSQSVVGAEKDIYLDTTSKVQFADLTNSTDDFIVILDGLAASTTKDYASTTDDFGDGWVLVRANPDTLGGL